MCKKVLNIKLLHALMHFFGGTCGVMSDYTVNVSHSHKDAQKLYKHVSAHTS